MHTVTIRFSDEMYFASMENSELEGAGESISDALRELAEQLDNQ